MKKLLPRLCSTGCALGISSSRESSWGAGGGGVAGVSVDTIRFYQNSGSSRVQFAGAGGYRLFGGEDIHDLTFVRHAQEWGFSLTEVKELLALRQKHHVCSEVQFMLKRKLQDVREKIGSLSRLEAELATAFRNCNRELRLKREIKHQDCCPLLTKLERVSGSHGNKHVSNRRKPGGKLIRVEEHRGRQSRCSGSAIATSSCCLPLPAFSLCCRSSRNLGFCRPVATVPACSFGAADCNASLSRTCKNQEHSPFVVLGVGGFCIHLLPTSDRQPGSRSLGR